MCDLQLVPDNAAAKNHTRRLMLKSFNITFHIESVFGTVHKESQSQTKFIPKLVRLIKTVFSFNL